MTAANLPGGPGTTGEAQDPKEPALPEPSPIATQPDMNGPDAGTGGPSDLTGMPPVAPLEPMSTKPRQIPGGGVQPPQGPEMPLLPGMQQDGSSPLVGGEMPPAPGQFDPAASGFDQQSAVPPGAPEDDAPKTAHRFVAMLTDVRRDNPGLSFTEAAGITRQALLLVEAEQADPLAVVEP